MVAVLQRRHLDEMAQISALFEQERALTVHAAMTEFDATREAEREDLLQQVRQEQQKAQRAPRVHAVRRAPKPEGEDPRFREVASEGEEAAASPAKKRRRRRRKPTGEAGGAPAAE